MRFPSILKTLFLHIAIIFFVQDVFSQQQASTDSSAAALVLRDVVITASRISEKIIAAPVSISKLNAGQIKQSPAPNFYDAMGSMKGVQIIVPSMGFKVLNTRGFSNTTNVRFVQLVDNIDNQSPHIGAPIASALCPNDLDIDHVEIIQGVASALYGMNATNGLANFTTKDPFTSEGLVIKQQSGINHVNDPNNVPAKLYNETSLRWAKVISPKWAVKINAGFIKGYDWVADNRDDLNPAANQSVGLTGAGNPAMDGVNVYGNESSNRKTLTLGGKNYVVARTGYAERDVADYNIQNWKGDAAVYYKPNSTSVISYTYRTAFLNSVYQRSNRFRLQDYLLQQHSFQYKSTLLQLRAYINTENTGNSYNMRSMAENIDLGYKGTNQWYADYTNAFKTAVLSNSNIAAAHQTARQMADAGRLQPGTTPFNDKLNALQAVNNWDYGAALHVKASMVHTEGSFDLGNYLKLNCQLQVGADARDYIIVPDGNYFINPKDSGRRLNYSNFGFFAHASKGFLHERLQVSGALRASSYQYFKLAWNPRATAVYAISKSNFVRVSYQNGYRFPSIFEGFSNINSGGVKRVGGLRVMSNGVFETSWLKSSIDAYQAAVNKAVNTQGLSQAIALEKYKDLLQHNTYTYLKPEQMHSFELGYRAILAHNKLFVDMDGYYNLYSNFIAQIEASVPNTTDDAQIPAALYDKAKQARYRLWTNSKSAVRNFGAELDLRYLLNDHYTVSANGSYQTLKKTGANDGLEDGFNTPQWMANAGITGTNICKRIGFGVSAKYQSSYYWQSFLINGTVPAVFNMDCMVSYTLVKPSINIKLGASNVFNNYYYSILGGPQLGGFYYTTLTVSLK